ncbi:MAG: LPS export ABC transporter periplasmic protein LptC [Gallionella sp.]
MTISTRVRHWLLLLPLLGLLGATYWLDQQAQPEPVKPDGSTRHDPDAIVENFSAVKLGEQGTPHFVMSATKMLHYPDDDTTALEAPRLTLLSEASPPLVATAKNGSISGKGDEVFLQDNVEVIRGGSVQQDQLTLQTEYLHIIPDQDLASSNKAVTVTEAHSTVNAVGMELNNKTRTIKLLSKVRSEYVPPHN